MNNLSQTTINYMKLEEAIELVLKVAKRHADYRSASRKAWGGALAAK